MSTNQKSTPVSKEPKDVDAKTSKPEADASSENSPPSQITATTKPGTDDAEASKHVPESDPSVNNVPQAENQTSLKSSPSLRDDFSGTKSINSSKTEDAEALKEGAATSGESGMEEKPRKAEVDEKDSATDANPQVQQGKNESTSKDSSPPGQNDVVPHPTIQDITPAEDKTMPEKGKNESTSKDPSPPGQNDVVPHPTVKDIKPAEDKTMQEELSLPKNDSTGINDPCNQQGAELCPKKFSGWKKLRSFFFPQKGKVSKSKSKTASRDSNAEVTVTKKLDEKELQISLIAEDIQYIDKRKEQIGSSNKKLNLLLKDVTEDFEELKKQGNLRELQDLRKDIMKLKILDPSKYKFDEDEKDLLKNLQLRYRAKKSISDELLRNMPQLHNSHVFRTSKEFQDFWARYDELEESLKLCLLCFAVFPENNTIRKRLMVKWWVAEGYALKEDDAEKYFEQLIAKGFIEPVNKNRSPYVRTCQMHPFYRSALVMIAETAKFLNFETINGGPTQDFSGTYQACLVGEGLISFEDLKKGKLSLDDLEKLHLLINVDEHILEFKPDWFEKMTNLNFLYLGRWRVLDTDHIEVEDLDFLSKLENMRCVKFLSLQGISNIIALPKAISRLGNLSILDIRACYNLESIPDGIEFLKNLMHLDMSECYLLEHMPKKLVSLKKLKVIKGFVISTREENVADCCTLVDLETLPELSKLCIYTDMMKFPKEKHVSALEKLKKLHKLTITWGGSALRDSIDNQSANGKKKDNSTAVNTEQKTPDPKGRLPKNLKKLDLKCFPGSATPYWLELKNLENVNLEKLYIRGGKLSDLGQYQDIDCCELVKPVKKKTWKVEVLRLKYLSEIEMEWRQLLELFPSLVYLEKVSCPKLTLFPCGANGVWINKSKASTTTP